MLFFTDLIIEDARARGETSIQAQIAGHIYTIDLAEGVQFQRGNSRLRRRIKRDTSNALGNQRLGTAGLWKRD